MKKDLKGTDGNKKEVRVLSNNDLLSLPMPAMFVLADAAGKVPPGCKKYIVGGTIIAPGNIFGQGTDGGWNRLDCEIVIIPKRKFLGYKHRGTTIECVLTNEDAKFDDEKSWDREIPVK
ncbi:MAG: hypothetical protein V1804_00835 [Patescibacteria group bacterium]